MQHICANTKYEKYANVCVPVFRLFLHSKYIDIEANIKCLLIKKVESNFLISVVPVNDSIIPIIIRVIDSIKITLSISFHHFLLKN